MAKITTEINKVVDEQRNRTIKRPPSTNFQSPSRSRLFSASIDYKPNWGQYCQIEYYHEFCGVLLIIIRKPSYPKQNPRYCDYNQ